MRICVIYTAGGPFKAYLNKGKALIELNKLKDKEVDPLLEYSLLDMPVEDMPNIKPKKGG
jgi:hypothetical protein